MSALGRASRNQAARIVIAFSLMLLAAAQTSRGGNLADVRIDNFGRVSATYYRGAQPKGHDFADLAALGVKTVIDLTQGDDVSEPQVVKSLGMSFVSIPMTTRETPSPEKVSRFLAIVNDPARQPVYVHCAGGRHRTGVMTAVYRMTQENWTSDRAFTEMKQYRFGADMLHPEFKQFVYAYHAEPNVAPAAAPVATVAVIPAAPAAPAAHTTTAGN
jgi:protein tyrosine/serine phosphatase